MGGGTGTGMPPESLEYLLAKQVENELMLRKLVVGKKTGGHPWFIDKTIERIERTKEKIKQEYGEVSEEIRKKSYLIYLNIYEETLMGNMAKPYCPLCKYMYEYPDGTRVQEFESTTCTKHPGRENEITNSNIAFCESYRPYPKNEKEHKEDVGLELELTRQFIKELQQKQ